MSILKRGRWSEAEKLRLAEIWNETESLALIALKMNRSRSSVRLQANKLKLPRRHRWNDRQRDSVWIDWDDPQFNDPLGEFTDDSDRIRIVELANTLNCSVDTVFNKLKAKYGSERELFKVVIVTDMDRKGGGPEWQGAEDGPTDNRIG